MPLGVQGRLALQGSAGQAGPVLLLLHTHSPMRSILVTSRISGTLVVAVWGWRKKMCQKDPHCPGCHQLLRPSATSHEKVPSTPPHQQADGPTASHCHLSAVSRSCWLGDPSGL